MNYIHTLLTFLFYTSRNSNTDGASTYQVVGTSSDDGDTTISCVLADEDQAGTLSGPKVEHSYWTRLSTFELTAQNKYI